MLSCYNKPWEAVHFMVADNCNVNQYIGRREGALTMVGCASHRLNLAVSDYLIDYETILNKIHALITKMRTIKGRAILRRVTDLSPLLRNDTRWSSTHEIVKRYTKLDPALNSLAHGSLVDFEIQPLMLRRAESERSHALLKLLNDFEGVTKTLQRSALTLSAIVNNIALESGIVKLQRTEVLSPTERVACADFRLSEVSTRQLTPPSELSIVQQAFKRRKVVKRSRYADVPFVPPTSNECERFFSAAKLVYSDLRKRMDASTLEMLMFLMYNKDMWDGYTVEAVRR
ncbi:hypothetical protein PHMEG_00018486 [Phytophthora megakarya]|uniref:HAT C-terminal dimerisation domain-containing protein n=1 Tax=Phytophthora megakarya TaxID=4795 RepID=A0A225VTN4_9STRA|nr:hypothetical protein PHMEG_00018486 [Phytophthora megakarya]